MSVCTILTEQYIAVMFSEYLLYSVVLLESALFVNKVSIIRL